MELIHTTGSLCYFQGCGSGPDPAFWLKNDPDPGFDDQKLKKITADKKGKNFWIKNYNLPIPRTSKLQKKPSALKKELPALQNMKFLNFFYVCGSFLPSWIRFPNMDPDPLSLLNPVQQPWLF